MIQRSICYLLSASLLSALIANSAQPEETIALPVSEMEERRQRTTRSIRRGNNKPTYQYTSPFGKMAENSNAQISLPEFNTSADIDKFIHSPLGEEILSTVVTSLVHEDDQANGIIAEVLENPKLLWEVENEIRNFREEKQHPEQVSTPRSPTAKNKGFKEKTSHSLTTVLIISPALLPSQGEYETAEWNFNDPEFTSQHQVIRLNVNKDVEELLMLLSSAQPSHVPAHSTVKSKQLRALSQRPEENLNLEANYNVEYEEYPIPSPTNNKDDYYEYPQDEYLDEEINEQEYGFSDPDYHDISFKDSEFSSANLEAIAEHTHNQLRFFGDLIHHGWPLWLEK